MSNPNTWRTPCTDGKIYPEFWTSKDPDERYIAQKACLRCPRLEECARDAQTAVHRSGVWAGEDYSVSKKGGNSLAPVDCGNPRCGRKVLQPASGRRRSFCNEHCRKVARKAAAA